MDYSTYKSVCFIKGLNKYLLDSTKVIHQKWNFFQLL